MRPRDAETPAVEIVCRAQIDFADYVVDPDMTGPSVAGQGVGPVIDETTSDRETVPCCLHTRATARQVMQMRARRRVAENTGCPRRDGDGANIAARTQCDFG